MKGKITMTTYYTVVAEIRYGEHLEMSQVLYAEEDYADSAIPGIEQALDVFPYKRQVNMDGIDMFLLDDDLDKTYLEIARGKIEEISYLETYLPYGGAEKFDTKWSQKIYPGTVKELIDILQQLDEGTPISYRRGGILSWDAENSTLNVEEIWYE